ncbi:PEP-CTERM sorting domain-containing protein [Cerasicoccus fimbriatus]|uniref:PEP-CTERM sorting domain-containing protein n=1 Tax=Cerasicoccus fimbriatus TaxID=3014554 RepID=UPI0022B4914F|nr:PEP-CTERM sorting domain-containing protein [Cerasicoccus sp. TK19100]
MGTNSTITIFNDADAIFNGKIGTGTDIFIQNTAIAVFNGELANNVTIDLQGGTTTVNSIKNNATINVNGGTLLLNQSVGNSASVNVNSGTLELGADDVFPTSGNQASLTMNGGTLDTQGYNVEFDSLTLNGDSTIDLGDNPNVTVDLGAISGSGTLTVINWVDTNSIIFNPGSSSIDVGTQVMFAPGGAIVDPNDPSKIIPVPVPEPSTYALGALLGIFGVMFEMRRRHKTQLAK